MKQLSIITLCLILFTTGHATAQTQEITLVPDIGIIEVGGDVSVAVQYDSTDNTLPVIGFRIHFDSAKLTHTSIQELFETGKLADPQIQEDIKNEDNDISTDKLILFAYQDINESWPGQALPLKLAELVFTATAAGDTTIHVTKVAGAAGFGFQATDADIVISDMTTAAKKAIIVAGSKFYPDDHLWDDTWLCTTHAYLALDWQGYTRDRIRFLSPAKDFDGDNDGLYNDVDGDATKANLSDAITDWATDAGELLLYMSDHGGGGTFHLNEDEILRAEELNGWLNRLQETMSGRVIFIYDACMSGSFIRLLTPPEGKERILITSSSSDEPASSLENGVLSFSYMFWTYLFREPKLFRAFDVARGTMETMQTAWLDANGDGIGYDDELLDVHRADKEAAKDVIIGIGRETSFSPPVVGTVSADEPAPDGETSRTIRAEGIIALHDIKRVWAIILRPDHKISPETPITVLPTVELEDSGGGNYEGVYDELNVNGTYRISVYAEDAEGMYSPPAQVTVVQDGILDTKGDLDGDKKLTLTDAVTALRLTAGETVTIPVSVSVPNADVDGDERIGLAEAAYILERVSWFGN